MEIAFWLAALTLCFTFAGYHLFIACWRRVAARPVSDLNGPSVDDVTVVLVVANEARRLPDRIENLLASDITSTRLDILVVSDGSTDETTELVRDLAKSEARVRLVELKERAGKSNGLNQGVAAAKSDIIVFADARQRFESDTIRRLVSAFADPQVGAVSGRLLIEQGHSAASQGIGSYWSLETRLRTGEAEIDSCIGCTGAVYAIRRELFRPIPADTLLDDVVIPMLIVEQGYRVLYDPLALAYDPQNLDTAKEKIRKRRTLAGNFQMLFRYPGWLLPWRNRLCFQLVAHKYLRLAGPFFLLVVLGTSAVLREEPFYGVCFWGQVLLYIMAILGLVLPQLKWKLFSLPAAFLFLNWMSICGLFHYLSGSGTGAWEMVKRK